MNLVTASALKRNCGAPRAFARIPARTPEEKKREANRIASAAKGSVFHGILEQYAKTGQLSQAEDPEVQGWVDLIVSMWRPPAGFEAEVAWGLTHDGGFREVDVPEPHVYRAVDGTPLLTAGMADGIWVVDKTHGTIQRATQAVDKGQPRVPGLVQHEDPLLQSQVGEVGAIWRQGDHGLRSLAGVASLQGGHGQYALARHDLGADRQQRQLRAGELSLGDAQGASAQQGLNPHGNRPGQGDVTGGGSGKVRASIWDGATAARSGLDSGASVRLGNLEPSSRILFVIDYKTGKWPVEPARTNLQVNAAGMALTLREFALAYVPGIYYARDGVFDWGDIVALGSPEWQQRLDEVREAALMDETPRGGPWCKSCWDRKRCPSAEVES